jgi:carbamoyl-phosphate synthase small subunit
VTAVELCLDDGTRFIGEAYGATRAVAGEVVFSTAMTGYVEALTDPSYRGQILVMTYPLVGGYGVPPPRRPGSLDPPYESDRIQVQGLVTQNPIERFSHHGATRSLGRWLADENVPGISISGIDTRALTLHLRERGTMHGRLRPLGGAADEAEVAMREVGHLVAPASVTRYPGGPRTVLVVDAGVKDHLIRSFLARGVSVTRAPFHADLLPLAAESDGIVIGSGPGDPKHLERLISTTRTLLASYSKPIFGICLGSQILALAAGGDTTKLPYGHHGVNQPVRDLTTGRCYITSQNHGYAVVEGSLPAGWEPWFTNANDGTNEGLRSRERPQFGVQFHPEAHPGPEDTAFLFDDFVRLLDPRAR